MQILVKSKHGKAMRSEQQYWHVHILDIHVKQLSLNNFGIRLAL